MTKSSGIGDNLYVAGVDLSGDVGSLSAISDSGALLDVTAIDKSAMERIPGLADGEISFNAFFNDATGAEHLTLRNFSGAKIVTYARGTTIGNAGAAMTGLVGDYAGTRGADGSLGFTIPIASSDGDGLRWGRQLTAGIRTDSEATNGASIDGAASSAFGAVIYLHVFSFTGTDVTIKVQDSANDSTWADLTGASFSEVTSAPTSERLLLGTGATVRRYLRAVTTTSAGFTSVAFAVLIARRYAAF